MAAKLRAAGLMAMPASTKKKKKRQAPRDDGFIYPDQVYQSMYAQLDSERKSDIFAMFRAAQTRLGGSVGLDMSSTSRTVHSLAERDAETGPDGKKRPYQPLPCNSFYAESRYFHKPVREPGPLACTSATRDFGRFHDGWCGEPAVIKCLSCVKFDPTAKGRYCLACFQAKHPWYRTPHQYIPISEDDDVAAHELHLQVHGAEWDRYTHGVSSCLEDVRGMGQRLEARFAGEKVEEEIRATARKIITTERHIGAIRAKLREEVSARDSLQRNMELLGIRDPTIMAHRLLRRTRYEGAAVIIQVTTKRKAPLNYAGERESPQPQQHSRSGDDLVLLRTACRLRARRPGSSRAVKRGAAFMDVSAELDMDEARKRQLVDATINNEIEVVVNMIEADLALIDHRVNRRSTLLSIAAQYGHEDLARYFISKGCPVNAHCGTQVAALVWAARLQDGVGMIKLLVNAGARVKAYPRERSWCVSPLHEAARLKRAGNCLCLTELGADPEVRMGGNLTAYEMAGVSSQASKNMREGVRRWEVRGLVDKLHQLACLKEGSETGISCSTRAVLDRRRTAGKPLPCLTFPEEASSRKRGTKDSPKQERHRAFAALMRTLFEKVDHDVRCEVVSCI